MVRKAAGTFLDACTITRTLQTYKIRYIHTNIKCELFEYENMELSH
jgi:hypothetical protein